jgi:hypothetical protein
MLMQYDRHSLPVQLLHQMKVSQSDIVESSGKDRSRISHTLAGKWRWPEWMDTALADALGSADKAEVIRGAALEERRKFLLGELELVTTEQAAS